MLPQPTPIEYTELELLDSHGTVLASHKLLEKTGNYMLRNIQPMQPANAHIQSFQGDGMMNIQEHTVEIVIETNPLGSNRIQLETELERHLWNTSSFRVGDFVQRIAAVRGISRSAPVGPRARSAYVIEITYIPREGFWIDESSGVAPGVTASQELYAVVAQDMYGPRQYQLIRWDSGEEALILRVVTDSFVYVDRPRNVPLGLFTVYNTVTGVL